MALSMHDLDIIAERCDDDATMDEALQGAINDGTAWRLQGSMGRTLMHAIESGRCLLGRKATSDYYGNRIPSRDEVKAWTMGSFGYVCERFGREHARAMREVA